MKKNKVIAVLSTSLIVSGLFGGSALAVSEVQVVPTAGTTQGFTTPTESELKMYPERRYLNAETSTTPTRASQEKVELVLRSLEKSPTLNFESIQAKFNTLTAEDKKLFETIVKKKMEKVKKSAPRQYAKFEQILNAAKGDTGVRPALPVYTTQAQTSRVSQEKVEFLLRSIEKQIAINVSSVRAKYNELNPAEKELFRKIVKAKADKLKGTKSSEETKMLRLLDVMQALE